MLTEPPVYENGELKGNCPQCGEALEYEKLDEFGPVQVFEATCLDCHLVANVEIELMVGDGNIST